MIGAVVLAAGASRRFGRRPKMLAPLRGAPLLAHALTSLADAQLCPIVVVTGASGVRVERVARRYASTSTRLRTVHNAEYCQGMASSLRLGLRALPDSCAAALICLGDMPSIDARLIRRLRSAWHAGLDYARPIHAGTGGHPVLISRRLFAHIDQLRGDRGARAVFDQVPAARRRLIDAGPGVLADIDTPAALRQYARPHHRCGASGRNRIAPVQ